MDLPKVDSSDLSALVGASVVGVPTLILLGKRWLLKLVVTDTDVAVINVYKDLIANLKESNDHLYEELEQVNKNYGEVRLAFETYKLENARLVDEVNRLKVEINYFKQELIARGMREHSRGEPDDGKDRQTLP